MIIIHLMYSYLVTIPIIACLEVLGLFLSDFSSLNGCPDQFTRSCYVSERLSQQLRSSNILQNNSYKIRKYENCVTLLFIEERG